MANTVGASPGLDLLAAVAMQITQLYEVRVTIEYPGFLSITEHQINDDVTHSKRAWAIGVDVDGWSGHLVEADGDDAHAGGFYVEQRSDDPKEIAMAIYTHGIGDFYVGGGCSDPHCPAVRS